MKTFFSFTFIILFSLSLFSQNQIELKLNLEKNKTYRIKTISEQYFTRTINEQQQSSVTKSFNTFSIRPISLEPNFVVAKIQFDSIGFKSSMPKMDVSSNKTGSITSTDLEEVMNSILYRFSKNVLTVKISYSGNILEISNLENFANNVIEGINSLKEIDGIIIKMQTQMMLTEESIKGMIEMTLAHLNEKTVQTNSKWDTQMKVMSGGFGSLIKTNYKLNKIEGTKAEIKGETIYEYVKAEPVEMEGALISRKLRGLGDVSIEVDAQTGLILKGTSRIYSQGSMSFKKQGYEMQIPIEVDTKSKIVSL